MLGITIGALVIVVVSVLVLLWGRACKNGTFSKQWVFGYRTPLTLKDKNAWVVVHRAAAPLIFVAGWGAIAIALIGVILQLAQVGTVATAFIGGAVIWLLVMILLAAFPAMAAGRSYKQESSAAK